MIESERNALIAACPVGAGRAEPASTIYKRLGLWTEGSIRNELNLLAEAGRLNRRQQVKAEARGFRWLYWREPAAATIPPSEPTVLAAG